MPRESVKVLLPTIETCRWRVVEGDDGAARCALVALLIGAEVTELSAVSEDACRACCQSFPPSQRRLNPVVAGLLHSAATLIIERGGTAGCTASQATELQDFAERSLDLLFPERFRVTPARDIIPCAWLDRPAAPSGDAVVQDRADDTAVQVCRHPDHTVTTAAQCRMCRDWAREKALSRFLSLSELVPAAASRSGPPVRRWGFGITTAPRRQPTLESCLDAVVRAGWSEPRLFLDGSTPLPVRYNHLPVTWREEPIGAWPAWYLALAELFFQEPRADAYVLLQDDVVLYDREPLRNYLEQVLWPGDCPGIISLFYTGSAPTHGWYRCSGRWDWGAQGFVFPPAVVRRMLAETDLAQTWLAGAGARHVPIPEALCQWVGRAGVDIWYASPSLSQHIGNTSTIWMDAAIAGGRRASWFTGSIESAFAAEDSMSAFPEEAFPCDAPYKAQYLHAVSAGRARMQSASVVICGLCRDARPFLPRTAARIERLGKMFRDYRVLLFENDSTDATRQFLLDWQSANPQVDLISESFGARKYRQSPSLQRAAWMAACRNRYRQRIIERYREFDYIIVLDTDLPGGFSFDGIASTFGQDEWDFVGSYGLSLHSGTPPDGNPFFHFDTWAFRPAPGNPADRIHPGHLRLSRGEPLLPVHSCFGGLGVYRAVCMQAAEYGGEDCEHVVFHERLRQAGLRRLFLNPSQIVLYSPVSG